MWDEGNLYLCVLALNSVTEWNEDKSVILEISICFFFFSLLTFLLDITQRVKEEADSKGLPPKLCPKSILFYFSVFLTPVTKGGQEDNVIV